MCSVTIAGHEPVYIADDSDIVIITRDQYIEYMSFLKNRDENQNVESAYDNLKNHDSNDKTIEELEAKRLKKKKSALEKYCGLWKSIDDDRTVDEIVRTMRKGRRFDF